MNATTASNQAYIKVLQDTVMAASLNYDVWWTYTQHRLRVRFLDILNAYPTFFRTSIHAHFVALVVALYRIYETRSDTFNLPGLIQRLKSQGILPAKVLAPIERRVSNSRKLWIKVSVLRNEAFAHRTSAYSVSDVFRKAHVTPNELRDLVRKTQQTLNKISYALNHSRHTFSLCAVTDTKAMLADLKAFRAQRSRLTIRRRAHSQRVKR